MTAPYDDNVQRRLMDALAARFLDAGIEAEKFMAPDAVALAMLAAARSHALRHNEPVFVAGFLRRLAEQIDDGIEAKRLQ